MFNLKHAAALCVLAAVSARLVQAAPADDIDDLKSQVAALKATVERLEAKLDALSSERAAALPPTPAAPAAPAAQPAQVPAGTTPSSKTSRGAALAAEAGASPTVVKDRGRISDEQQTAPRVNNEVIDPELKGFFHFPGTDAIAKVDGYLKMDFIHDLKYAGNPALFITSAIPVPPNGPLGQVSTLQFKQSTLNFELQARHPVGQPTVCLREQLLRVGRRIRLQSSQRLRPARQFPRGFFLFELHGCGCAR